MITKGIKELCEQAEREIETMDVEQVMKVMNDENVQLVDIRDIRELWRDGAIPGSTHAPRGMLEFWIDPNSQYFKEGKLDLEKEMVLFCAAGARSALAAKSLLDMGFKKVSHVAGGFGALKDSEFKII